MKVLMVGVDKTTRGGMWTVVENYLNDKEFMEKTQMKYIPTSVTGSKIKKVIFSGKALMHVLFEMSIKRYDILHAHMSERGSVYRKSIILSLAKLCGCKTILHMHGAEFESWYRHSNSKTQKYVKKTLDKADQIIILGAYWQKFIETLITDKERIKVVYNAVSVPDCNQYNIKASKLLFLGVVGKRKGMDDLLDAIKCIENEMGKDVKLLVYGPDFDYGIDRKIGEMDLGHIVEYKGWLDKLEREKVFSEIAINILPSYNEGLPMTILETMAYGIPNISTNIAAIPEVVDEKSGILIEPGDSKSLAVAIKLMMENDGLRLKKSDYAYADMKKKFSISYHMNKIIEIYTGMEE